MVEIQKQCWISRIVTIMSKPRCRGCNDQLTPDNDSAAHIIPKALGGRLAPKGLICRKCNTALDDVADNALIEAFGAWPTLLDIPRQGSNPPKLVETREGYKVRLEPDGSMTRIDVKYVATAVPEGTKIEIAAGDMKTFRQLLKRAEKDCPQFDVSLAEKNAKAASLDPSSEIKLTLDFRPSAVFGGVITAIWLFLIKTTGRAFMDWTGLLKCIKDMQTNGGTFRYFADGLPGLQGPRIDLGHKLIVRSVPSTGELIAYVEILGVLKVGGLFAKSPRPGYKLEHIYVYDLIQERERSEEFTIDPFAFEPQDWNAIGVGPNGEGAPALMSAALETLVAHYQRKFSSGTRSFT
jgi:hypothetical protein